MFFPVTNNVCILEIRSCPQWDVFPQSLVSSVQMTRLFLFFILFTRAPRILLLPLVAVARRFGFKIPERMFRLSVVFGKGHRYSQEDNGGGGGGGGGKQEVEKEKKEKARWEDSQGRVSAGESVGGRDE